MKYRSIFRHYWKFIRQYPLSQIGVLSGYGIGKLLEIVAIPLIFKYIIDTVSNPPADPSSALFAAVWVLVGVYVVMNVAFRVGDYYMVTSQSKIMEGLTDYALAQLQKHSYAFFTNAFTGGLIAKARRFVHAFEILHDQFVFAIWFGLISLGASTVVLFYYAPLLGGAFLLWLLSYIAMVAFLVKYQIPKSLESAAADTKVTAHLSDIISNFFTVKIFGTGVREEREFKETTQHQQKKRKHAWMQQNFWSSLWQGAHINGFTVIFLAVSVWLWLQGEITAGTIVLMQIYVLEAFDSVWGISKNFIRITTALTDAKEMVDLFDQEVTVKDPQQPEEVIVNRGDICFEKVSFLYEGKTRVFKNLNLHINAGERVALVGHSGAGKTTITKLLLRFADVQSGAITIDGQDITHVLQDKLREKIAYVPQEPLLFHRTLRENIAYAKPDAPFNEVESVAKRARAHEFISSFPNGYDTLVGERGVKLSGGERQRVAIARAMLKDAPIIVLDEATSSLDSVSEKKIQEAFEELMDQKTTIVIAHRLSTIQRMDRIIVFDKGKIIEEGTHRELLHKNGIYNELWSHQAGGFLAD